MCIDGDIMKDVSVYVGGEEVEGNIFTDEYHH